MTPNDLKEIALEIDLHSEPSKHFKPETKVIHPQRIIEILEKFTSKISL